MKNNLILITFLVVGFLVYQRITPDEEQTPAPPKQVHVYAWSAYITEDLIDDFTSETGIEMILSTYITNEEMYATLKE